MQVKKRCIHMAKNKKGFATTTLMAYVFIAFFLVFFLGCVLWALSLFDNFVLGLHLIIGTQNFTQVYEQTTQKGITAIFAVADYASLGILFGLVIVMALVGYYWGDETKKFWAILDILIILIAEVISVYIQNYFIEFINSQPFSDTTVFTDTLSKSSTLLANLPYIVPVIGILIMIVTYGLSRRKTDSTYGYGY